MDLHGKNVLVVGSSGVLGSSLVSLLLQEGASVIGTCSSQQSAAKLAQGISTGLILDLTSDESISSVVAYLEQNTQLDGVIIASGVVGFGRLVEPTIAESERMMKINFSGPAYFLSQVAKAFRQDGETFVAAITGVVAEKTFPGMAVYSASKSAFSAWLATARLELRKNGTSVTEARPGHTETGLANRAIFGTAPAMPEGLSANAVARVIVEGIKAKTPLIESAAFANAS